MLQYDVIELVQKILNSIDCKEVHLTSPTSLRRILEMTSPASLEPIRLERASGLVMVSNTPKGVVTQIHVKLFRISRDTIER